MTSRNACAQTATETPVVVGIVAATKRPIAQTSEYLGRIEAVNRVNVVARITAFLDKRVFSEGAEVRAGDLLYQLERGPFEADLATKQAQVVQLQALLENATRTTTRARSLLGGPAGLQSNYDTAISNQLSIEAQIKAAQAQVQLSQISLGYTEIRSPVDGMIGRTAVTSGNLVSQNSGVLATIVSQDPMYITFPVSVRNALDLRKRYAEKGGLDAVIIKLTLPNGIRYDRTGKLEFVNNTIAMNTDTVMMRGVVPNPPLKVFSNTNDRVERELTDGEFVSVSLEGVQPVDVLVIPRAAVLSDQQGDYIFSVDGDSKAVQRRIKLGQSTSSFAAIDKGLVPGDKVIVDNLQRIRQGQKVVAEPASSRLQTTTKVDVSDGRNRVEHSNDAQSSTASK